MHQLHKLWYNYTSNSSESCSYYSLPHPTCAYLQGYCSVSIATLLLIIYSPIHVFLPQQQKLSIYGYVTRSYIILSQQKNYHSKL